jgi:phosphatidylserine decarboxylase
VDKKDWFVVSQYLLPQHCLSRAAGWLADTEISWIKTPFIRWFANRFRVDMREAEHESLYAYPSFNAFFTRALKPGARPIDSDPAAIVSPADGMVSQLGEIEDGRIFQAKGKDFSLIDLLGGNVETAKPFMGGEFATLYLSPKDYHRVHMPVTGRLVEMRYIPGKLFSVNQATAEGVPELFARNERVVCVFETELGPMAMVLVGAMIVASIETVWAGNITPLKRTLKTWHYRDQDLAPVVLEKGAEMGRFKLGSTVILCFGKDAIDWEDTLEAGAPIKMGERLASQDD